MNQNNDISLLTQWVKQVLQQTHIVQLKIVVDTPWSFVIKINTDKGAYYLKKTPKALFVEPNIIATITMQHQGALVPEIIGINHELTCFLMRDSGLASLRTHFNGIINESLWCKGIEGYVSIQRKSEKNIENYLNISVPDWRLDKLPAMYQDFVNDTTLLRAEGLSHSDCKQLQSAHKLVQCVCNDLLESNIKQTLVNCDFNESNIIYNHNNHKCVLIDWGESVITHPFFSAASQLFCAARRYKLNEDNDLLISIRNTWLSNWQDIAPIEALIEIYKKIKIITPIFVSFSLARLQAATINASKQKQNWFIGKILQSFITNCDIRS